MIKANKRFDPVIIAEKNKPHPKNNTEMMFPFKVTPKEAIPDDIGNEHNQQGSRMNLKQERQAEGLLK